MGPPVSGTVIDLAVPVPLVTDSQFTFGPTMAGLASRVPTAGVQVIVILPLSGGLTPSLGATAAGTSTLDLH
jgi:hypothetical protein